MPGCGRGFPPDAPPRVCGHEDRLCTLRQDAAGDGHDTRGVFIRRGDEVLAEAYCTGTDKPGGAWFSRTVTFDAETLHDLRSISKSVVGLLVGVAVGRGLLGDPETALARPVYDFFPEHADLLTPERRGITLRHVLDMCAGWEWDETSVGYGNPFNSETRMGLSLDPLRHVLSLPQAAPPGRRWAYCGGATVVLAELLERVGRPILPAAWVVESRSRRQTGWDGFGHGAQWWQGPFELGIGRGVGWTAGWGNGGQRVLAVPALDVVMVITAGRYNQPHNGRPSNALARRVIDILGR